MWPLLVINLTEAKLLLALNCCIGVQPWDGVGGRGNKGWEQKNKHTTAFEKAALCRVLQEALFSG